MIFIQGVNNNFFCNQLLSMEATKRTANEYLYEGLATVLQLSRDKLISVTTARSLTGQSKL
jgi:hypothetical protein